MKKRYAHHNNRTYTPETNLTAAALPVIEHIAEQMPGGFFIYRADGNGEILFANSAMARIFGCENREEFREYTGLKFPGLIHPDDRRRVELTIQSQVQRGDNRDFDAVEYRIIRRDGAVRYLEDYGRYVQTEALGGIYYVFVADVTDRHAIQEENQRRNRVIDGVSQEYASVYLLNLVSGEMLPYRLQAGYMQKTAEEFRRNGMKKPDWKAVFSLYAQRYVLDEDRDLYLREIQEERIRERLQTESSYQVDYRCFHPGGGIAYMCMNIVKIEEEDPRYVVMGYKDISRETLRVMRETTEKMHTEMELEKLRHANEMKSSFLFNVSHDIRTPMNAVLGFTALARRHMGSPDLLRNYLDKVDESGRHMMSLVDDLLEMGQIDVGEVQLREEPADLRRELETAVDLLRPQAASKGIVLTLETGIPENRVMMDAVRFRRIMTNLIGNAVKFTPRGGAAKVWARVRGFSASGYARYEIAVSDNGVGMTEEFLTRIFRPFEREQSSTQSGQAGTGLGLSIVKRLLDMMGGTITAQSKKGEGSVFTVQLPLKRVEAETADHPSARPEAGDAPSVPSNPLGTADELSISAGYTGAAETGYAPSASVPDAEDPHALGNRRILLAEDIELNRMLAETVLEEAGFLCESVADGCDAVEIIKRKPAGYYDLVLMDIQMPVMNGCEAARAIRAMGRSDTITLPILALSANAREEDRKQSLDSGMNGHIAKPFDVADLIQTINVYIAEREEREAGGAGQADGQAAGRHQPESAGR